MPERVLDPSQLRLQPGRDMILPPAEVTGGVLGAPVAVGERRVAHDGVGRSSGVGVVAKRVPGVNVKGGTARKRDSQGRHYSQRSIGFLALHPVVTASGGRQQECRSRRKGLESAGRRAGLGRA